MPRLTRVSGHGLGGVGVQMDYPDGLLIFAVQACQGLSSLQPADAAGWILESQERRWGAFHGHGATHKWRVYNEKYNEHE